MAYTTDDILSGLAEIVTEETGVPAEEVQLDKSFADDLDIDSLSMMSICTFAEEKFDVRIPDEELQNLVTVQDAVSYIEGAQS
ncbi:MAG: acyl carrier protein [Bowdeniella nasicola]|nr:acyl carrier protein [Bowdeniella nasicola]